MSPPVHYKLLAAAGAAFLRQSAADIPVHCLKPEVVGEWDFFLTKPSAERSHCGHRTPDRVDAQPAVELVTPAGGSELHLTLHDTNRLTTKDGKTGAWTMVYDEGFEFKIGDMAYFAFSRFDHATDFMGNKKSFSTCSETLQGWYSDKTRSQYGCYVGKKVDGSGSSPYPFLANTSTKNATVVSLPKKDVVIAKHSVTSNASANNKHEVLPDSFHAKKVLALNQRNGATWTAKVYKRWLGKSLLELNLLQGLQRRGSRSEAKKGVQQESYVQQLRGNSTSMPQTWDWRSARGKNWLTPVIDQGSCGSCYAVSGMNMLTARHRITQNDPTSEAFSIAYPMACSEYNQGCDGGYGFLIAKWSQDVGLVPESCAPYDAGFTCGMHQPDQCNQAKKWRATNYGYVGGFYGATNEQTMKDELYQRGPVTSGFQVADDFMWYEKGIYSSGHDVPANGDWVKVDHGVMMIGWGEEAGVKYWSLQNSWGPSWGEQGYFRFKRGENLGGIESICEMGDVVEDEKQGSMVSSFAASP